MHYIDNASKILINILWMLNITLLQSETSSNDTMKEKNNWMCIQLLNAL